MEQRSYSSQLFFNGNVGLGYGFELFAGLPYVLSNRNDVHYSYGEERESSSFDGEKGFSDATFGLRYRAFKSADGNNEVLLRFSLLRHSGFFPDSSIAKQATCTHLRPRSRRRCRQISHGVKVVRTVSATVHT
ncbi:MAG: hypothetical protein ABI171_09680 [Collimonas sp.]